MKKAPTIVDVAALANVSMSTAARVLRSSDSRVNPALAVRVESAARELGYTPNLMARSLRGGTRAVVGLMVGDMLDPYFAAISEAVTVESDKAGMAAMVANMRRDPDREIELLRRFMEHRVFGVILAGGGFDQDKRHSEFAEVLASLRASGTHVVALTERAVDVPTFTVDDESVGRLAAEAIANQHHSKVAVLFPAPKSEVTRTRLEAAVKCLEEAECEVQRFEADYTREAGFAVGERIFGRSRSQWPTGVVAGSDSLGAGLSAYLRRVGIAVPRDVSVVGIGNTYFTELSTPPLTSVDVATTSAAKAAVKYLAELLNDASGDNAKGAIFEPILIARESVAPPVALDDRGAESREERSGLVTTALTEAGTPALVSGEGDVVATVERRGIRPGSGARDRVTPSAQGPAGDAVRG